jgi:hypothetical protein
LQALSDALHAHEKNLALNSLMVDIEWRFEWLYSNASNLLTCNPSVKAAQRLVAARMRQEIAFRFVGMVT